jgi:hypothetical protein
MRWKFQDHWDKILRLKGVAHGDRNVATAQISDAMNAAGAAIVDVHLFSGVMTVLAFEVAPDALQALGAALTGAGLELDAVSADMLAKAPPGDAPLEGTLSIAFPEGDPDLRRDVPSVPG